MNFSIEITMKTDLSELPKVKDHVEKCIERGVYDPELTELYSDDEFIKLESFIDHDRDYYFTYAGLRPVSYTHLTAADE